MPTMHDVALRAGVSLKTVSRVVNGEPSVSEQTRQKVDAAIAELDFRPNSVARNLRTGRIDVVGLALPHLSQPYFSSLAEAIMREAERHGLTVLIELTDGEAEAELALVREHGPHLGGLLMYPVGLSDAQARTIARIVPTVFMSERAYDAPVDRVAMANREGVRALVGHLVSLGYTRIAALGADHTGRPERSAAHLRLDGYQDGLRDAGLSYRPELVIDVDAHWSRPEGAAGIRRLIERGIPFDAVIAFADALALGALHAVREAGLRVPTEVAIAGFDNTDEARYSYPALTSIAPGTAQIAREALALLNDRMNDAAGQEAGRLVVADFELMVRESTLGGMAAWGGA
ncbi:LacI family DNA-binding transcriptional regulator [Streptomyces ipomoeae]|uniref:LacI family DNA-binding transcriptional regulator n=1 Tax=Streptomyces ipomoeae TaxID=103232 RepID=UPI0011474E05|nr:LacI family DNA-binding transcriptional regulator [Streptomyces ipomoeae]MDX2936073.1 LacI family DNA-binding transcriptional regulator [Streptomyces ipomoeae]TQE31154.1 LacI family transcriptional regulator [Streptomyces ipomoeae]